MSVLETLREALAELYLRGNNTIILSRAEAEAVVKELERLHSALTAVADELDGINNYYDVPKRHASRDAVSVARKLTQKGT